MKNVDSSYPWERQTKETEKAYEAFLLYKNAGPGRTVIDVARKLQKSYTLIRRWDKKWNWEDRVLAYDRDCERKEQQAAVEARKAMVKRHIKIGMQMQGKALKALEDMKPDEIGPATIKEFIRLGTMLESMNRSKEAHEAEAGKSNAAAMLADVLDKAWRQQEREDD